MRMGLKTLRTLLVWLPCAALSLAAGPMPGQALAVSLPPVDLASGLDNATTAMGSPDGMVFAEGTRAINEGRWADAVAIFSRITEKKSDHADGALYWKAYALNKLGQAAPALESCTALRAQYSHSSWVDECGALEIEMHAKTGKPIEPKPEQSDDLKLLALNSLLRTNEAEGRQKLEEILSDEDASAKLKEGAQFLLGQKHTGVAYPQIARVSYVEGDVRIARGKESEKAGGAEWEQVEANTPLESGFNLVTGNGKAEIELEDASTIYMDENTVLSLNDLHATDGVPYTDLALLSGTVSLHVKPYVPGETFLLQTPTDDNLYSTYPNKSYLRVTSYVDATAVAPVEGGVLRVGVGAQQLEAGQTLYLRRGHRIDPSAPDAGPEYDEWAKALPPAVSSESAVASKEAQSFADWDKWVADRVQQRKAATAEVMAAAGLSTPLPGMAEMQGRGRFFACEPYGTCWEPAAAEEWEHEHGEQDAGGEGAMQVETGSEAGTAAPAHAMAFAAPVAAGQALAAGGGAQNANGNSAARRLEDDEFFPCGPDAFARRSQYTRGFYSGVDPYSYRWAVCHSGSWIRHKHHYVWVAGKRHHHPSYHWAKAGRTLVYIPIHPRDVKGEFPVNGKERPLPVRDRIGGPQEPVKFDPNRPITVLKDPPREFRSPGLPALARAEEPRIAGHSIRDAAVSKGAGVPISFDHKSQTFTMAQHVMQGGHQVTIIAPISNHGGNLQSHSGGVGGSHGGGSAGGGSHSGGGGSSGGGGGSHASSGGSSSGGSGSSGAASSGGGSHH